MKKALAILLIALFVVSFCAGLGCAKKTQPKESTTEETAPAAPAAPAADTTTTTTTTTTTGGGN